MTKKFISKVSPFLIKNLMGNSMRLFSSHENDSVKSYSHFSRGMFYVAKIRVLTMVDMSILTYHIPSVDGASTYLVQLSCRSTCQVNWHFNGLVKEYWSINCSVDICRLTLTMYIDFFNVFCIELVNFEQTNIAENFLNQKKLFYQGNWYQRKISESATGIKNVISQKWNECRWVLILAYFGGGYWKKIVNSCSGLVLQTEETFIV